MINYVENVIRFLLDDDLFLVDKEDENVDTIPAESDGKSGR